MEALHDVVKAGKARYIGASSMYAWQFETTGGRPDLLRLDAEPLQPDLPRRGARCCRSASTRVFLAAAATVITSQAVITGPFSVTQQAAQLGYLPRSRISPHVRREDRTGLRPLDTGH